jgi:DNA polymerase-3 subunit alpha
MVDLHRHDEFSFFDGFGKATELAELAKQLGHTSLSVSNHGNVNGLIKHYQACKKQEINCIMGAEVYFQPVIDRTKKSYHLCLFAKNLKGYESLNNLIYMGEKQKYYKPIICFDDLEKFSDGLICSSACIGGLISSMLMNKKEPVARKAAKRFQKIFGDDFYIEIQPYRIDKNGTQERVNCELIWLAKQLNIECVLTSDSHYGAKDDFDTYLKMHEIAKHTGYDIKETYGERYMPTESQLCKRFRKMHSAGDYSVQNWERVLKRMQSNLEKLESKVEQNILDELKEELPSIVDEGEDAYTIMLKAVKEGLKRIGKHNNKVYVDRCKQELKVIKLHGFADYFLIVADYVKFAKDKGILVGPGRGSVCNCEVAYLLGITTVDSIRFNLNFERFLREDKGKLPDIDLDFETSRRQEVIDYLVEKYLGHAAQICSYGLYKVDNLINDLGKVCGLEDAKDKAALKTYLRSEIDDTYHFSYKPHSREARMYNEQYDNIVKHFDRLYNKVRFIGTHAAGVAITGSDVRRYTALRITKDKETGREREYTVYDLADLDIIHVVKFDMLGLKTMESIGELRRMTGHDLLQEEAYDDPDIWRMFADGETDGVFQFEATTPRKMLMSCECDCFEDMIAVSSMNRPGPLSMKMPEQYAHNKFNLDDVKKNNRYYEYTKETYGTIVYQEQLQQIATKVGKLSWADADRLMKLMKQAIATMGDLDEVAKEREEMTERFVKGAMENGWSEADSRTTFKGMLAYLFNKGHSVSYGMISLEEMYYKVYYPLEFWYTKIKFENDDEKIAKFKTKAVAAGQVLFLPHVNYSSDYSIREIDGDKAIQEGLSSIKGIGAKAAAYIAEQRKKGPFRSVEDFTERCKSRAVTSRVVTILKENGALEFDKKLYQKRVQKYNSALYSRGLRR